MLALCPLLRQLQQFSPFLKRREERRNRDIRGRGQPCRVAATSAANHSWITSYQDNRESVSCNRSRNHHRLNGLAGGYVIGLGCPAAGPGTAGGSGDRSRPPTG